jgi:hypothetical protein
MSTKTVHAALHKDLKLSRKLARRVPKLMDEEMKKQQGVHSNNCIGSLTILDNIHTDGELKRELVSLTLTKETSKK